MHTELTGNSARCGPWHTDRQWPFSGRYWVYYGGANDDLQFLNSCVGLWVAVVDDFGNLVLVAP